MKYGLVLGNPKDFYNEIHRASHFIKFIRTEDKEQLEEVDHEDYYNWVKFFFNIIYEKEK